LKQSFSGVWAQLSSSLDLSLDLATGSYQQTLSAAQGVPVGTIHNELVYAFDARIARGVAGALLLPIGVAATAGTEILNSLPPQASFALGATFGTVKDLFILGTFLNEAFLTRLQQFFGSRGFAEVTLGGSIGGSVVFNATDSNQLSGPAFGFQGVASYSTGPITYSGSLGVDFGFNATPPFPNGAFTFGGSLGTAFGISKPGWGGGLEFFGYFALQKRNFSQPS
jgi:hypothetical protein